MLRPPCRFGRLWSFLWHRARAHKRVNISTLVVWITGHCVTVIRKRMVVKETNIKNPRLPCILIKCSLAFNQYWENIFNSILVKITRRVYGDPLMKLMNPGACLQIASPKFRYDLRMYYPAWSWCPLHGKRQYKCRKKIYITCPIVARFWPPFPKQQLHTPGWQHIRTPSPFGIKIYTWLQHPWNNLASLFTQHKYYRQLLASSYENFTKSAEGINCSRLFLVYGS